LLGALSGGGVAWLIHRQDSYTQRVQKTRDTLLQLIELRGQIMDSQGWPLVRMEVLYQKRAMLLSVAEGFAARAGGSLSAHDWIVLGTECQSNRDYKDACAHLKRAVECSDSEDLLTKVIARRVLAAYYYEPGRLEDPARGARLYAEAVALTRGEDDAYLRFCTGWSLASWAWWAARNDDDGWEQLLQEAKDFYAKAIDGYPPARGVLEELERQSQGDFSGGGPPPPVDPTAAVPEPSPGAGQNPTTSALPAQGETQTAGATPGPGASQVG
jgi:hypothetical protein